MSKSIKSGLKLAGGRRSLVILAVAALVFLLFFWRLGSLTPGLGPDEAISIKESSSLQNIVDNPVNAPFHLLQWLFIYFFNASPLPTRLASALLGIGFIACFYVVASSLFGRFVGVLSTLLLASTPLVVLLARNGSPRIMLLAPLAILAFYYLLIKSSKRQSLAWLGLCAACGLFVYSPGAVWVILIGILLARQKLMSAMAKVTLTSQVLGLLAVILLTSPLILGLIKSPHLIKQLLLIPDDWPSVILALKMFVWSILSLVWRTPGHFDLIVDRLPFLSLIQLILAAFGFFAIVKLATKKVYTLIFIVLLGAIASAINNNILLMIIALPAIALFVAGGLKYLYVEWRTVFPRNPIPKYLALILMSLLVFIQVAYGVRYSLSAWPNTKETKAVYVIK